MKILAGVIGSGVGKRHIEAIDDYKSSKVLVICEKNKKKIIQLKKEYPDKIITNDENVIFFNKKINLISIASYDNHHFNQILKCIDHKKNFIVEKPMCLNLTELKKINFLLRSNRDIKMMSNLVLRYNSLFKHIKKNINKKKVFFIEADYIWGRRNKLFQWRSKIKNYSLTLGAAIHMIDLVMWLLNDKPISVTSYGNNIATKSSSFRKKSFIIYVLKFKNNLLVKITANASAAHDHFHELRVYQNNKSLINSFLGAYTFLTKNKKIVLKKIIKEYPDKSNRKNLIRDFIDFLIKDKKKAPISHEDQIRLMTVCFYADKSLQDNKEKKIKYFK